MVCVQVVVGAALWSLEWATERGSARVAEPVWLVNPVGGTVQSYLLGLVVRSKKQQKLDTSANGVRSAVGRALTS